MFRSFEIYSTLIIAGHETTATTSGWLLHELSLHPSDQARLRDEIFERRGLAQGKEFEASDYDSMPILNAIIKVRPFLSCQIGSIVTHVCLGNAEAASKRSHHYTICWKGGRTTALPTIVDNSRIYHGTSNLKKSGRQCVCIRIQSVCEALLLCGLIP